MLNVLVRARSVARFMGIRASCALLPGLIWRMIQKRGVSGKGKPWGRRKTLCDEPQRTPFQNRPEPDIRAVWKCGRVV